MMMDLPNAIRISGNGKRGRWMESLGEEDLKREELV